MPSGNREVLFRPMMSRSFPKSALVALLLAFFAFYMSALISRTVFNRIPHLEDEVAYLFQARTYAGGHLVIPSPEPRRAYWQPFVVDQNGMRFGKYTPGWSLQLALGVLMGQTWVINAFLAALTTALVYRLGREIFNDDVGVIAAALTAFSPIALLLAGSLMGHTAALFAATLFLYAYWRIERGRHLLAWGLVAGIGLGLLVANRPITGIAVGTPLILRSGVRLVWALVTDVRGRQTKPMPTQPVAAFSLPYTGEGANMLSGAQIDDEATAMYHLAPLQAPTTVDQLEPPSRARGFVATLKPLIALSVITLMLAAIVPINNTLAVGSPTKDLYTLVWSYDRVGFGTCCGRSGHTLEKGIRQAGFDLSLTSADLFGWQIGSMMQPDGTIKPEMGNHLLTQANYWYKEGDDWVLIGISWILLPFGFLVAYRRKASFVVLWVAVAFSWLRFASAYQDGAQLTNPTFAWLWIITALVWLYLPLLFWRNRVRAWTWILWCTSAGLIILQMTYWIGSQLYSTRYYFEGLTGLALISAIPIAWLARRFPRYHSRPIVYGLLALVLAYSLYFYSTPRISTLTDFNFIDGSQIAAINARRTTDKPVLVLVNGTSVKWRATGTLMGVTSPYLDSDIVVAWNYSGVDGSVKQQILDRFPDREVIEMNAQDNTWWFPEETAPTNTSTGGGNYTG